MAEYVIVSAIVGLAAYGVSTALAVEQNFETEQGRLDDLRVKGSQYGSPIPYALGHNRLGMSIVWAEPLQEHIHTEEQDMGGKGGGGGSITTTTYSYTANYGGVLSYNQLSYPLRIYADKELVWEQPAGEFNLTGELAIGGTFEFLTGAPDQAPPAVAEAVLGAGNTPAYRGRGSIWFTDVPCKSGRRPSIEVECSSFPGGATTVNELGKTVFTPPATPLKNVVDLVAQEAGIDPSFIDATDVSSDIVGVCIKEGTAGSAIETLTTAYNVQGVFRGDSYKFASVDQTVPDWHIPEEDLLRNGDSLFPIKMARDEDMPHAVYIKYQDVDRNHQSSTQRAFRKTGRSTQKLNITLPYTMTATTAAQLAESVLYRAWTGQRRYGPFELGRKWLHLEAGDIIKVEYAGKLHTMRILKVTYGANLAIRIEAEAYDPTVATLVATGSPGDFAGKGLLSFGSTYTKAYNLPALTPLVCDRYGFYLAATGTGAAWRGGILEASRDGGASWNRIANHPAPTVMGQTNSTLPAPPADVDVWRWDWNSTVDILMYHGTLNSVTENQLLSGANAFIIGNEVVQARDAEYLGNGVHRLSVLLRGRRGTREAMASHATGESFAVANQLTFCELSAADKGMTVDLRFTPYGGTPEQFSFDFEGKSAEPWRPEYVKGDWAANNDITISFDFVTRRAPELLNAGVTPPEYPTMKARLTIYGWDWSWIAKTVDLVDETSFVLTEAEQVAIWGWAQSGLRVGVQQYSPYYGYGVEHRTTIGEE